MNNHLSQDQLAMWIIGRCTAEEERHGRECPLCSAELARFQEPISIFRRTMQDWSHTRPAPCLAEVSSSPGASKRRLLLACQWGIVGLAGWLLIAALFPLQREGTAPAASPPGAVEPVPEPWQDDAVLMDAIAIHLSRSVPAPMEPIFVLVPQDAITFDSGGHDEDK